MWGLFNATLRDKVCQWLATGRCFFSGYSGFLHKYNWPPWYSWNIVESGVKHHNHNLNLTLTNINIIYVRLYLQLFVGGRIFYLCYLCLFAYSSVQHLLCFCVVFLRLVYPMLPVSLGCVVFLFYFSSSCVLYVVSFSRLCCVFVLFFFVLCTLCCQFL